MGQFLRNLVFTPNLTDALRSFSITKKFGELVRSRLRQLPEIIELPGEIDRLVAICLADFNRIRSDFKNNGQTWAIDIGLEESYSLTWIEEGYMTFTNEEILSCFEP